MYRFRGTYDYSIDDKGRVNIPAKFRKMLQPAADETFVITLAPGKCLRAYPQDAWAPFEDELHSRPETPDTLAYKRLVFNNVSDSQLDSQGRVLVPAEQLRLVEIRKNVVLSGQGDFIEIWDTDRFNATFRAVTTDQFDDLFFKSVQSSQSFKNGK